MTESVSVITIDGPSGTGKGTISLMVADQLKWNYLDSGAIYRVLAYALDKHQIAPDAIDGMVALSQKLNLNFKVGHDLSCKVYLDGDDISADIRTESVGKQASIIAAIPKVRQALVQLQRCFATQPGLVTDGRDMGTVIFPEAKLKIFLTAAIEERAQRRYLQLKKIQNDANLAQVVDQLAERDARDCERSCSPLVAASDAVAIDTTSLSISQVFKLIMNLVNERFANQGV